jgi:Methylase involved in ubiquinone/menaquinone biosynthesis
VTAVDPEPEMLAALKEAAERADLAVSAVLGSSFSLPDGLFNLVVMGRAFHWTDRSATAKALDAQITAGGAIALFDDETIKTAENRWRGVMDRVAARFGADKAPHRAERADPAFRSHESILLDSPFSMLETVGVVVRRPLSLGDILGYAASLSVTSRHALGEKHTAFESELTEELLALSPKGRFSEIAEMRALIARRP